MPNYNNYKTNIPANRILAPRFTVSRIIESDRDALVEMEVPAEIPVTSPDTNVEISLYSLSDNNLITSEVINNSGSGIFTTKTIQYEDGSLKNLLFIDFSKTNIYLPIGKYSATINIFHNELGSKENDVLKISRISPSRTEVELELTDPTQINKLVKFSSAGIGQEYIVPIMKQIFNQSGSQTLAVPASSASINSENIFKNFGSGSAQNLIKYQFDVDNNSQPGINSISQQVLNIAYPIAIQTVNSHIINNSGSFSTSQLTRYVVDAIDIAYDQIINDTKVNPQKYRFNLL